MIETYSGWHITSVYLQLYRLLFFCQMSAMDTATALGMRQPFIKTLNYGYQIVTINTPMQPRCSSIIINPTVIARGVSGR